MACMSEASLATGGVFKVLDFGELGVRDWGDEHLSQSHAAFDGEGCVAEVDEWELEFAAVVGVDGAWGVNEGDAVFGCKAGPGSDLGFVTWRDGDCEATGDEADFVWVEGDGLFDGGGEVEAGGEGGHFAGEGQIVVAGEAFDSELEGIWGAHG